MESTQLFTIGGIACFGIASLMWMAFRMREHRTLRRIRSDLSALIARYSRTYGSRRDAGAFLVEIGAIRKESASPFAPSITVKVDLFNGDPTGAALAYVGGIVLSPFKEAATQWFRQKKDQLFPESPKTEEQSSLEYHIRAATSRYQSVRNICGERDCWFYTVTLLGLVGIGVLVFGSALTDFALPPPSKATPTVGNPNESTNALEFQKAAIQRYPELGISGSPLNTKFVARYRFYQKAKPEYFREPDWPVKLAKEIVGGKPAK